MLLELFHLLRSREPRASPFSRSRCCAVACLGLTRARSGTRLRIPRANLSHRLHLLFPLLPLCTACNGSLGRLAFWLTQTLPAAADSARALLSPRFLQQERARAVASETGWASGRCTARD